MAEGLCALCQQQAELQVSHLVPRFVALRLKEDSPNPFMRKGNDPERRVQDTPKEPLLCRACEERFSVVESAFAKDIFSPVMDGVIIEGLELLHSHQIFCASLAWRHLVTVIRRRGTVASDDYTADDWKAIEAAEVALRDFFCDRGSIPDHLEFHLACFRSVTDAEFPGINALLNLTAGFSLVAREDMPDRLYSIIFMNGLLLVTLVRADEECRGEWAGGGTRVAPGNTWRSYGHGIEDAYFGGILLEKAKNHVDERKSISPKQQEVISKAFERADKIEWLKSPHGKAVMQDYINKRRKERPPG
jgi:hypothetical protein